MPNLMSIIEYSKNNPIINLYKRTYKYFFKIFYFVDI